MRVVLDLLGERVGQTGEAPHAHSHREVLTLHVGRRDVRLVGAADDRRLLDSRAAKMLLPLRTDVPIADCPVGGPRCLPQLRVRVTGHRAASGIRTRNLCGGASVLKTPAYSSSAIAANPGRTPGFFVGSARRSRCTSRDPIRRSVHINAAGDALEPNFAASDTIYRPTNELRVDIRKPLPEVCHSKCATRGATHYVADFLGDRCVDH